MENTMNNMGMQSTTKAQAVMPVPNAMSSAMPQMTFPEIYYRLQPYIMMVCDHFNSFLVAMPSQDQLDTIADSIYDDVCKRNPGMAEYLQNQASKDDPPDPKNDPDPMFDFDPPFGRWRFRRRGLPRDLIEILLLSELFNRRRRFY